MSIPLKQERRVSLRQCALHNSYYAKELMKSRREVSRLTKRILELEKEKVRYREQVVNANNRTIKAEKYAAEEARRAAVEAARANGILQFGFKEETIKADIKKLENARVRLNRQVVDLEKVIITLKRKIRQIKIQDGNHQLKK